MDKFKTGDHVTTSGFPGVIVRELPYAEDMYEVRLASGLVAVCGSDIKPRIRYERVTFLVDETTKKTKSVFLNIVSDTARMLSGYEVGQDTEEIVPAGFSRRLRVLDKTLITKRVEMVVNRMYGTLERKR